MKPTVVNLKLTLHSAHSIRQAQEATQYIVDDLPQSITLPNGTVVGVGVKAISITRP